MARAGCYSPRAEQIGRPAGLRGALEPAPARRAAALSLVEVPGGDATPAPSRCRRGVPTAAQVDVRDDDVRRGKPPARTSCQRRLERGRRSRPRSRASTSTASGRRRRDHRREAEPRGRDREHARAAADVEHAARARRPAAAARGRAAWSGGRRCRTRAPGRSRPPAARPAGCSQGGPTQSGPTTTGRWKRRQASSQPGLHRAATASPANARRTAGSSLGFHVDGELDRLAALALSSWPAGTSSSSVARRASSPSPAAPDGGANELAQRKALFILSKNPRRRS